MTSSAHSDWFGRQLGGLRDHEAERATADGEAPPELPRRYQVRHKLGEGGAAVVYRALDRDLNRDVAVKILHETLGRRTEVRERFQREATVLAAVTHPNIVSVFDAGETAGRLHLVMEYVDGRPFDAILDERATPLRELVQLLEKA